MDRSATLRGSVLVCRSRLAPVREDGPEVRAPGGGRAARRGFVEGEARAWLGAEGALPRARADDGGRRPRAASEERRRRQRLTWGRRRRSSPGPAGLPASGSVATSYGGDGLSRARRWRAIRGPASCRPRTTP